LNISDNTIPLHNDVDTDHFCQAVVTELDTMEKQARSPMQHLGTLALSLIFFVSLGLFRNSFSGIALLVVVLFVHELGHFIGMKLLRYKDIQMFFIPLFGAAVSGKETAPSGARKALVALCGPVPGIIIGITAGIAYLITRHPLLADAARTFLFINTFNLLPFHPLDGGRFFDAILFSRHPRLEIVFKILTTVGLIFLTIVLKSVLLGFLTFVVILSLRSTYITAKIAYEMKTHMNDSEDTASHTIPTRYLQRLIVMLREKLPVQHQKPKLIAKYAGGIWQRMRNKPCGAFSAIGLFLCYVLFILLGIGSTLTFEASAFIFAERHTEVVSRTLPTGDHIWIQVTSVHGQKIAETQVNNKELFDGTHVGWSIFTKNKNIEGYWKDGFRHGVWTFWDNKETPSEIIEYDMGKPVYYRKSVNGTMQDVPREKWQQYRSLTIQYKPLGIATNSTAGSIGDYSDLNGQN